MSEFCNGTYKQCPVDLKIKGSLCRNSTGTKSGINGNEKLEKLTTKLGPCDTEEYCNGTSNFCPTDLYAPINTTCRPVSGIVPKMAQR